MSLGISNQFDFGFLDFFKKMGDYRWGEMATRTHEHTLHKESVSNIRNQSRMDFEGADFSGLTLENFSFIECNLVNTNFSRSSLKATDFTDSLIRNADFDHANLELAVFDECDLSSAVFKNSNLKWASFKGANLSKCDFSDCSLEGAIFDEDTVFYNATFNENTILPFEFENAFKKHMKLI